LKIAAAPAAADSDVRSQETESSPGEIVPQVSLANF